MCAYLWVNFLFKYLDNYATNYIYYLTIGNSKNESLILFLLISK